MSNELNAFDSRKAATGDCLGRTSQEKRRTSQQSRKATAGGAGNGRRATPAATSWLCVLLRNIPGTCVPGFHLPSRRD